MALAILRLMNVRSAFAVLELDQDATVEDVGSSFRRLLKTYHPDHNTERSEWSHQMTVRLNEAYDVAISHLRTGHTSATKTSSQPATENNRSAHEPFHDATSAYSLALQASLAAAYDALLDGIYDYYNFGLFKMHLRNDGTHRLRHRTTVRRLGDVVARLTSASEWPGSDTQHNHVSALLAFSRAFRDCTTLAPPDCGVPVGLERKAYRHHKFGTDALDLAIRGRFFPGHFPEGTRNPSAVALSERSFATVIEAYPRSAFVPSARTRLKMCRTFRALCEDVLDPLENAG